MRRYSPSDEETLRARQVVKEAAAARLLATAHGRRLAGELQFPYRQTNGFLRAILFLFTAGSAAALVALVFELGAIRSRSGTAAVWFLFSAVAYGLTEYLIATFKLYRHGIEEALAVASVVGLGAGLEALFLPRYMQNSNALLVLAPFCVSLAFLFLYLRFGYLLAAFAALIALAFVPAHLTASVTIQRLLLGGFYLGGILGLYPIRRRHRQDYLDQDYGIIQAMLFLALYLVFNLQLKEFAHVSQGLFYAAGAQSFPRGFYWFTYGVIWVLPFTALHQAIRDKDRPLLDMGVVLLLLTLVTNKPYLGWPRHTWDPMVLGVFLIGVALLIQRWLGRGPAGGHAGFTAEHPTGADKRWRSALGTASALMHPSLTPAADPSKGFGGGSAGGGGATGNF